MLSERTLKAQKKLLNLYYMPSLLLFLIFTLYPLISGFSLSFMNWDGYSASRQFSGLENYRMIIHDEYFGPILVNTLIFGFGCTCIHQFLGILLAIIINKPFLGCKATRTILYMPVLVSPVIMGSMYYMLLQYNGGAFNDVLILLGKSKIAWLSNPKLVFNCIRS